MHLTFDWTAPLRRAKQAAASSGSADREHRWKRFPYGDRIYRYCGPALHGNWSRLHRGDREPYPNPVNLADLLRANPALVRHVPDVPAAAAQLEDAWRAYHAGDFADAVARGLAAGPIGGVVAARAAVVYAVHLEEDEHRRAAILRETVDACSAVLALAPNWANAWFVHGLALGRYGQHISVMKALAQGLGSRLRESLQRSLYLEPEHADAHMGLGVYCAEVIDKVGAVVGGLTYGVRKEAVIEHFEAACALWPQSPVVLSEYARSLQLVGGDGPGHVDRLCAEVVACQPADALERLDVEWARGQLD